MTIQYKDGSTLTCHTIFIENGFINADDIYSVPIEDIDYISDEED